MPFAPSGSLFDKQSHRIEEIINKSIETFMPTMDPAWRDTIVTAQGVGPASQLGRDMKIIKNYRSGNSGIIEPDTTGVSGKSGTLYGGQQTDIGKKLYLQGTITGWPDPGESTRQKVFQLGVGMKAMLTNFQMTMGELQAEATPAFIGEIIAPALKGFAQNMSHTLCNYWYISGNDQFQLGAIDSISASSADNGDTTYKEQITFVVADGVVDRFQIGQRVDILDTNVANARLNEDGGTRKKVFVSAIDELAQTVTLVGEALAFFDATPAIKVQDADKIVYANATGFGIAGINSWLKGSGRLLANSSSDVGDADPNPNFQINVDDHPEFRSMVIGSVGTLTEHKLRLYLRRWHAAKSKYGQSIDCLIASDGVWLNYEAQKIGQYIIDRTSRLSSIKNEGSDEGFLFTFEGKTYKGYTSTYVEDGTVYGLKKGGGNWKRYVPPTPKGVTKMPGVDSFVPFNFVMPALTGTSSAKFPILADGGGAITDGVQMPGMMRMQLVPDQPAGMKLTGVSYDKILA